MVYRPVICITSSTLYCSLSEFVIHKRENNTNTYVLDTTICTQTHIPQISPLTNNWMKRRTEHHFYAEIVTDITTRNTEYIKHICVRVVFSFVYHMLPVSLNGTFCLAPFGIVMPVTSRSVS
jgi:hypothetical protein